jgi:hypothetical protein
MATDDDREAGVSYRARYRPYIERQLIFIKGDIETHGLFSDRTNRIL